MPAELTHYHYGKSDIRLTKVTRRPDHHELCEIKVDIILLGDLAETYTEGDNRRIVATDSMRNTVYLLAKEHPIDSIESFATHLASHFVRTYPQISQAIANIELSNWNRIITNNKPHRHSFLAGSAEKRTCRVVSSLDSNIVMAGIANCEVLKTTDSLFQDFVRDEFTTLPDADDRIFATKINAQWEYNLEHYAKIDWNESFSKIRQTMLDVFCEHRSLSVQQTLFAMGQAVIESFPSVDYIDLTLPNQHRIPFNFTPFGKENKNDIFVTTSEPYGKISAVIHRSEKK